MDGPEKQKIVIKKLNDPENSIILWGKKKKSNGGITPDC